MGKRDKRVDDYIAKQRDFARPILTFVREVVHEGCPDVEETIKWGMPSFTYHGILAGMAGFKEHASFGFWKHTLLFGDGRGRDQGAMGSFGRLSSVTDLPPKRELVALVRKACELNDTGARPAPKVKRAPRAIAMPSEFKAALARNKKAQAHFDAFPPSHRREYLQWIAEAKRDETREKRIAEAVRWIAEGKQRNWKYM
ncbi:MAG TPA: YdeI/OmpD-associated family protein [Gemmatimonadaceae bacterium]|nr:YdeI/OmpD-associated family protein [Gemmatimonadaceae bacterium]